MILALIALSVLLIFWLFRLSTKSWSTKPISLAMLSECFIVLDLETTGLQSTQHEFVEIGAIRVNRDSKNHETFQTLITLAKPLSKQIVQLTGITQIMIDRDGVPLDAAVSAFLEFIGDLPLVAFNAKFDLDFLKKAAGRQGKTIPNKIPCASEMSRRAWPGLKNYKLQTLAKMGGLRRDEAPGTCRLPISFDGLHERCRKTWLKN